MFLVSSLNIERIFRWQAGNVLREYGAEHHIDTMVAAQMTRYGTSMLVTAILAGLVLAAGVLIRFQPAYGLRLLMLACTGFVGHLMLDIVRNPDRIGPGLIIRGAWWACLCFMAFRAHRRLAV